VEKSNMSAVRRHAAGRTGNGADECPNLKVS
jgi:hypothetical protein